MQAERKLQEFLEALSSRAATPGGGAASALAGSIAAALCGMVARLNDKKDGTPGALHGSIGAADALMADLLRLMDEDMRAFDRLAESWKLPSSEAGAQAAKQAATLEATRSPIEIMSKALFVMKLAAVGLEKSKKGCLSDAGAAGILAHAALEAARLNVLINLPGITDAAEREELRRACASLHSNAGELRREIDDVLRAKYES